MLLCVGVQMVHSSSLTSRPSAQETVFLSRHLTWLALSAFVAWILSRQCPASIAAWSRPAFWGYVVLLVLVLTPGIGSRINGAQRWLRFSGLSFQPSELGRLILPMLGASKILQLRAENRLGLSTIPETLAPLCLVLPLVAAEPDLGATLFLTLGFLLALYFAGWPLRYFIACGLVMIPAAGFLLVLRPYQMRRITGFLDSWKDLAAAPWQIRQSLMSLGSGGLEGTGIGAGWQKLSYLPEANTDFVFAVIGEELGLLGTLTVCFVWISVYLSGRTVLSPLPRQSFAWVVGTTLLTQLVIQAMANIAVVTAMVPPKGVPHPFISYGGTNLLVSLSAVGLLLGMAANRQPSDIAGQSNR
ncbi:MAG: Cell division protein FtsW [Planctomycetota bacterium]